MINFVHGFMERHHHYLTEFGFNDFGHFFTSLIRPKLLPLSIPLTITISFFDKVFGLQPVVFIAFLALLFLELFTGICASYIEGQKITSKRMKSFLIMLFVWLIVLFILNTFKHSFEDTQMGVVFSYLFDGVVIFVNVIYFKSIWENMGRISGKKAEFGKLSNLFSDKLEKEEDAK